VLRFDAGSGVFVGVFVPAGSGGLDNPGGLAFGPDGNLYVASRATGAVLRFDGATGAFVDTFVAAGTGGLAQPIDIAFGPDGNLYVSNLAGLPDNILRFDGVSGAFIDVFATEPTFNLPRHIEFGGGVLWAAGEADRIWRFDAVTGAFLDKPMTDNPRGLALGADGLMYSSSSIAGVFRHDVVTGAIFDTFIAGPLNVGDNDIAFGPDGNLYMSGFRPHQALRRADRRLHRRLRRRGSRRPERRTLLRVRRRGRRAGAVAGAAVPCRRRGSRLSPRLACSVRRASDGEDMRIEIICTGDEVLTGKIVNSNFSWISQRLEDFGLSVVWGTTIGDDREQLLDAFLRAGGRADAVIVNGGLGPTVDDLSQEIAARPPASSSCSTRNGSSA
jgi:hypothetical protein